MKTTYVCPDGLHYDVNLNLCNWPEKAGCRHIVLIPENHVLTPMQQFLLKFALPYNAHHIDQSVHHGAIGNFY